MDSLLPLLLLLSFTSIAGFIYRAKKGVIKKAKRLKISEKEIGSSYGDRLTILQFSTTFCSECRSAKAMVKSVVADQGAMKPQRVRSSHYVATNQGRAAPAHLPQMSLLAVIGLP